MQEHCREYLEHYLNSLPKEIAQQYQSFSADYFCASQHSADLCAKLIFCGEKRATCSMDYWYRHAGETRPMPGHLQVVTTFSGEPVCVIETLSVTTCRYCDVTAEFAFAEGEGDKTLKWWQKAHWDFFSKECAELGIEPNEQMLLVLEHFKVVYPRSV
ncbi:ASCH domain-containing protein [Celerinatantimonas sp. MCCC 1A17872]|uniref:ASCH domain-containing protein n=1 Tax=Celerinatantimonas sp. MCCC 1A17872 TaxID=3177514 RepID=UPI0038C91ADB